MPKRILWVEDELEMFMEFTTFLHLSGHELISADSATEAENLVTNQFDRLIIDVRIRPGTGDFWLGLYTNGEKKIGLKLLDRIFSLKTNVPEMIIILSNEHLADIAGFLEKYKEYNIKYFRKRDIRTPEDLMKYLGL